MIQPISNIQAAPGEPIVFRTTTREVAKCTFDAGSIWLRSAEYYRSIEDIARSDRSEGINSGKMTIPLQLNPQGGTAITVQGSGTIGQAIVPHYIASFHGSSIPESLRQEFGGITFGVKSFSSLSAEILYQATRQVRCTGYRYGKVYYQHTGLTVANAVLGSAAVQLGKNPPWFLNPLDTDVLRKSPVEPFIQQDEYRIVVFVTSYISEDVNEPLKLNVSPDHFYAYLQ
ncbi:MAG: hypothetical protein HGB36_12425 [Chlorobiaceae bacterium]|nr:hypothetical protein [Chlorobiaceae bacterium]